MEHHCSSAQHAGQPVQRCVVAPPHPPHKDETPREPSSAAAPLCIVPTAVNTKNLAATWAAYHRVGRGAGFGAASFGREVQRVLTPHCVSGARRQRSAGIGLSWWCFSTPELPTSASLLSCATGAPSCPLPPTCKPQRPAARSMLYENM
jgi:hypothetical protein